MTTKDFILTAVKEISRFKKPTRKDVIQHLARNIHINTETINRTFRKMINEDKTLIEYKRFGVYYLMIPSRQLAKEHKGTLEDYFTSPQFHNEKRTHTRGLSQ